MVDLAPFRVPLDDMLTPSTDRAATDDRADAPTTDSVVDVTAPFASDAEFTDESASDPPRGRSAENPLEIPRRGWKDIALRLKDEWSDDHVGLSAAGVAFYSFLALIPAMAALVSVLGLVVRGRDPEEVINDLFGALPQDARQLLSDQLTSLTEQSTGSLSFGLVTGLLLSLWSASGAVGQLVKTMNIVYDEEDTRSWIHRRLLAIGLTLGAIVFVASAVFIVVGLPAVIDQTGLGIGTRRLLNILIWPALAIAFGMALTVLYRVGPDRSSARWQWVTVGSVFAVGAWIAATLGFRLYVASFGSYNETYGSLAAVVVMLMWLWITAVIVLLGAEINAEIEHQTARDSTIDGDQPMGERGAVKADTLGATHD